MSVAAAESLEIHEQVWGLLAAIANLSTYDGEVPKTPPSDEDDRVYGYAVLYMSAGRREALMLDGTQGSLFTGFQVTCVGGYPERALWCLDKVRTALIGAEITIDGHQHTITAADTDPGPVRRDDDVKPPRHYVPDRFELFIP